VYEIKVLADSLAVPVHPGSRPASLISSGAEGLDLIDLEEPNFPEFMLSHSMYIGHLLLIEQE
jgi:hypothetical protein